MLILDNDFIDVFRSDDLGTFLTVIIWFREYLSEKSACVFDLRFAISDGTFVLPILGMLLL